ncbi:MAG TPA: hypothetical protein PLZ78_08895 [Spirochaetota bacterium]|nr:hypothetical protein [Spirochaetota bacterium]
MSEHDCIQEKRITTHGLEIDSIRDRFLDHLSGGKTWRITITSTLIGTIAILAVQLICAVFFFGKMTQMVEVHDRMIFRTDFKVQK